MVEMVLWLHISEVKSLILTGRIWQSVVGHMLRINLTLHNKKVPVKLKMILLENGG